MLFVGLKKNKIEDQNLVIFKSLTFSKNLKLFIFIAMHQTCTIWIIFFKKDEIIFREPCE